MSTQRTLTVSDCFLKTAILFIIVIPQVHFLIGINDIAERIPNPKSKEKKKKKKKKKSLRLVTREFLQS